ncbi:hypothetical protein MVEN_00407600 [Mycena venus]|uniref:Uncharacterized protein n=1 Tax=Mycena venus TaxID=2733690 RepID=A0A8H6YV31_9AGAR|nr:hypothetical protein MVEN_00407600 [Mycena venus]
MAVSMEAPVFQEWAAVAHLVQPPKESVRPEPKDTEPPPPIPDNLLGRECLYGYIVTAELMETYRATHHPNDPLPNPNLCLAWNHTTIYNVATSLGLKVFIDHLDTHDIAWFSYTKGGIVKARRVPTPPRLERFAKELGLTEQPQWHDAGLPVQN